MNKRKSKRLKRRLRVTVISESRSFQTYTGDVSAGGFSVRTLKVLPKNTLLTLELELPSGEILSLHGRVTWDFMIPHPGFKRNGMGIHLTDRPEAYIEFIRTLYSENGEGCIEDYTKEFMEATM